MQDIYSEWKQDPEAFWLKAAQGIDWISAPKQALDAQNAPFYEWFVDSEVNACYNAVDRHVEQGRGEQTAIIYDKPRYGHKGENNLCIPLQEQTALMAGVLKAQALKKGIVSSSTCR